MAYIVPGIYVKDKVAQNTKIGLDESCVVGFVGITEQGPIGVPVRINSFEKYQEHFGGFTGPGLLAFSVYGFFNTGGRECVIVRTASLAGESSISTASLELVNKEQITFGLIRARSAGTWGNAICCKIWYAISARYSINDFDKSNSSWLSVTDDSDLIVGDTIRLQADGQIVFRQIIAKNGNHITLNQGIENLADIVNHGVKLERLALNFNISNGKKNEEYLLLSPNPHDERYFANRINQSSRLVEIQIEFNNDTLLLESGTQALHGGRDGVVGIEPGDFIGSYTGTGNGSGLGLFDAISDITLVCIPDLDIFGTTKPLDEAKLAFRAVQLGLINHAEKIENRFAILDAPGFIPFAELPKWAGQFDTMHGAMYYPSIQMIDPLDQKGIQTVRVPVSGHIAGIFSATDETQGTIHTPANKYIPGAVGLGQEINESITEFLYPARINCLKNIPGRGIKVWGGRTLSSDPQWKYISVRRAFSRIASALRDGTRWAVFETNNFDLRKRLIRCVSAFLIDLWHDGYLVGKTPDEAFFVRCDDELNPIENISAGLITVQAGICLAKPAEFIVISIVSEREGSNVLVGE